jgi:hypothetical protein
VVRESMYPWWLQFDAIVEGARAVGGGPRVVSCVVSEAGQAIGATACSRCSAG